MEFLSLDQMAGFASIVGLAVASTTAVYAYRVNKGLNSADLRPKLRVMERLQDRFFLEVQIESHGVAEARRIRLRLSNDCIGVEPYLHDVIWPGHDPQQFVIEIGRIGNPPIETIPRIELCVLYKDRNGRHEKSWLIIDLPAKAENEWRQLQVRRCLWKICIGWSNLDSDV